MSESTRIRATYDLLCGPGEDPSVKAADVAREQTVEMPAGTPPPGYEERVVGVIEELHSLPDGRHRAMISYDPALLDDGFAQLLNLVYGNISMMYGIRLVALDLPDEVLTRFGGPRYGIPGVRTLTGVPDRPILCTALKPVGLSANELGELAYRFARGGIDIVKDDHSLADQRSGPFRERVSRCQEGIARANGETGSRALYFPSATGSLAELSARLDFAHSEGCLGVMLSPLAQGFDSVRLAAERGLAVLTHPTMSGAFFGRDHGIAPEVLLGDLVRLAGADGSIYPNPGGRFPEPLWSVETSHTLNRRLRGPLGDLRPTFPVPSGGVDAARVPEWFGLWGADTIFLVGGSLYAQGDIEAASKRLLESVERTHERLVLESRT
jgi:ribulose-bisphosphate carboxylase large chain